MRRPFAQGMSRSPSSREGDAKLRGVRTLAFEQLESRQLLSLTHWYTFNDGTGADLIGSADLGIINGALVQNGQVVLSNAGVTSGQATTVQYVNMPTSALPASGPITVLAWFTANNAPNWTRLFDFGNRVGSDGDSYLFFSPQSSFNDSRLVLSTGGGPTGEVVASATTSDDGAQHMVAAVVDTATDTLRLYLDGSPVGTAGLAGADMGSITKSVAYFGRSIFNADPGLTGSINEIQIYDEALSATSITTAAAEGPTTGVPDPPPPVVLPARQLEDLDRGLIALRRSTSQIYVGWRMLGTDPDTVAFNLYRSTNGGAAIKLNSVPLTQTTDYVDSTANMTATNAYYVRPIIAGIELAPSDSFMLDANAPVRQYLNIPLQIPAGGMVPDYQNPGMFLPFTYNANDASVGDLDGDGQYEIILKWDPSNSHDNSQSGFTGNTLIDAYKLDGTLLWRIDLGQNIRAGADYTQFIVYDLDGDGKAEVAMRTAPGTKDGQGNDVLLGSDNPNTDYRNSSGYNLTSPEYLTIFDGETGAERVTVPYLPDRVNVSQWGDSYGNRVDRFLMSVAYLDGVHPSLVLGRGIFGPQSGFTARNELTAWDFNGTDLNLRWWFKAGPTQNSNYVAQGVYVMTPADVDGDGKDEIVYGAMVVDDDGTGLYSTGRGHGDALHVGDLDPSNPGLEIFMPQEDTSIGDHRASILRDGDTGVILAAPFVRPADVTAGNFPDVGRGVALDIDPNSPGYEFWDSYSTDIYRPRA